MTHVEYMREIRKNGRTKSAKQKRLKQRKRRQEYLEEKNDSLYAINPLYFEVKK